MYCYIFPLKMYGYILESQVVGEPIAESLVVGEPSFPARFFQYLQATGCHRRWCSTLQLSEIVGCAACAPMYHSQPCAIFGWHLLYHPEAHRLLQ